VGRFNGIVAATAGLTIRRLIVRFCYRNFCCRNATSIIFKFNIIHFKRIFSKDRRARVRRPQILKLHIKFSPIHDIGLFQNHGYRHSTRMLESTHLIAFNVLYNILDDLILSRVVTVKGGTHFKILGGQSTTALSATAITARSAASTALATGQPLP
jgi:hypothetical protein